MRIATGGISHETSTFTLLQTDLDSFRERGYLHGAEITETFAGTNTPIGGFMEGAAAHGFEIVPIMFAEAHPSGPVSRALFDGLVDELVRGIEAAKVDGVLLDLHGSMVVDSFDSAGYLSDPEGHLLTAIREAVGADVPILVQLDIHSNVSTRMIEVADVLIGRETDSEDKTYYRWSVKIGFRGLWLWPVQWRGCLGARRASTGCDAAADSALVAAWAAMPRTPRVWRAQGCLQRWWFTSGGGIIELVLVMRTRRGDRRRP